MAVARAQLEIGYHTGVCNKGHQWMMRIAPRLARIVIVAVCRALLFIIARHDRRIQIKGQVVYMKITEEPAVQGTSYQIPPQIRHLPYCLAAQKLQSKVHDNDMQ